MVMKIMTRASALQNCRLFFSLCRYQIILLGNRDMYSQATHPEWLHIRSTRVNLQSVNYDFLRKQKRPLSLTYLSFPSAVNYLK